MLQVIACILFVYLQFLHDILNALFDMFASDEACSQYSNKIFKALVSICVLYFILLNENISDFLISSTLV